MTITPHLLYSSVIHFVLIAYILSIPIYKGSLYSMSFGSYSVDLVSEKQPAAKAAMTAKAPRSKPAHTFTAPAPIAKTETPAEVEAPPSPHSSEITEPSKEPTTPADLQPGITLIPEEMEKPEPKKETLIVKAETPPAETNPEKEKKPEPPPGEPPKKEPVIVPPPPETSQKTDVTLKELTLPKEPITAAQQIVPAETKPSKADNAEEPVSSEFPVKADEKAEDVTPAAKAEKVTVSPKEDVTPDEHAKSPVKEEVKVAIANLDTPGTDTPVPARGATGQETTKKPAAREASPKKAASAPRREIGRHAPGNGTIPGKPQPSAAAPAGSSHPQGTFLPESAHPEEPKEKPPFGIAVPEALFHRDIKIEVIPQKNDSLAVTARLSRKAHPSVEYYRAPEPASVDLAEEDEPGGKKVFSVANAEKGIYTFVMRHNGDSSRKTSLVIRLLEGKKGARDRKFEAVTLDPHGEFSLKFLMPEGIFWDDESYFTGSIESSDSITKFNDVSGIVWKENKD